MTTKFTVSYGVSCLGRSHGSVVEQLLGVLKGPDSILGDSRIRSVGNAKDFLLRS